MRVKTILSILLLLTAVYSCDKEEDEKPLPDGNYMGLLNLEYSRTFPEFTASLVISLEIFKSGEIIFEDPQPASYSAEDELDLGSAKVKINETGNLIVSSLDGEWRESNGIKYLIVDADALISGLQNIWGWDYNYETWVHVGQDISINVENPVEPPLEFIIQEALLSEGSVLGVTLSTQYGSIVYKWTLKLYSLNEQ